MSLLRTLLLAAVTMLLTACASNPTPHPAGADIVAPGVDVAAPPDLGGPAPDDGEKRDVCADLGGAFADADGLCDLGLETSFDAEPQAPAGAVAPRADVVAVAVTGDAGAYTFAVTIQSDDTGCDGYADWWEVLALSGELRYRRVLTHSHVDEQPFTRSGGPVPVAEDDLLIVRAHRHPEGYSGHVFVGSVAGGFTVVRPPDTLARSLDQEEPQPTSCAY